MADVRATDIDDLFDLVRETRLVLLGEATHGTHEFYALRAELTKRLVAECGFRGLAVEADWPAAARANRYIQGVGDDREAEAALGDFRHSGAIDEALLQRMIGVVYRSESERFVSLTNTSQGGANPRVRGDRSAALGRWVLAALHAVRGSRPLVPACVRS